MGSASLGDSLSGAASTAGKKAVGSFADSAEDIMSNIFGGLISKIALRQAAPVVQTAAIGVGTLVAVGVVAYLLLRKK